MRGSDAPASGTRVELDVLRFAKPSETAAPAAWAEGPARGGLAPSNFLLRKKMRGSDAPARVTSGTRVELDVLRFAKPSETAAPAAWAEGPARGGPSPSSLQGGNMAAICNSLKSAVQWVSNVEREVECPAIQRAVAITVGTLTVSTVLGYVLRVTIPGAILGVTLATALGTVFSLDIRGELRLHRSLGHPPPGPFEGILQRVRNVGDSSLRAPAA